MRESLKLIRVFLASPGDLREERLAARDAADEVNRLVARPGGYQIELLGWEETVSSLGRPQALINKELETCELFIGMMWKRWGTPPSKDGLYTSGFEEEYELSRKRFGETGEPQMGMFFKNVDPELLSDPGEDLKKVIAFQDRLIDEKAHLFQTFDTKEEFSQRVRQFLATHVHARTARDTKEEEQRESAPKELREQEAPGGTAHGGTSPITTEPTLDGAFLGDLAPRLHRENGGVSDVEIARLRLVAASVKGSGNDDLELGVHDANLLYRFRQSLAFAKTEISALARAGLANISTENVPFWTWYAIRTADSRLFLPLASYLGTAAERVGALEVMRELSYRRDEDSDILPHIRSHWFEPDAPKSVKTAALRYLRENGSLDDVSTIEGEIEKSSSDTLRPAVEALAAIYLRDDAIKAAKTALSAALESIDPGLLDEVLPVLAELADEELRGGLNHRNPKVRLQSLNLLSSRGSLDEPTLRSAAEDGDGAVRTRAVELLDEMIGPIDFKEAATLFQRPGRGPYLGLLGGLKQIDETALHTFKRRRFMHLEPDKLQRIADSDSTDRHLAMFCLATRDIAKSKDELRKLIDDKFEQYISKYWPDGVPSGIRNALLFASSRSPEEEKRRELMRAAFDVIEANGDSTDLQRVRRALDEDSIQVTLDDIEFIEKFGDSTDVARLLEAFERSVPSGLYMGPSPNLSRPIAQALLKIVRKPEELLDTTLPPAILKNVLALYPTKPFAELEEAKLTALFFNEADSVRKAAVLKCLLALPKRRISILLREYLGLERQFYNVIHWLDLGIAQSRAVSRKVATKALSELP